MSITPGHYQKILTVAMLNDELNRRTAEDRLTSLMPGSAVPSYQIFERLPEEVDEQQMMGMMDEQGFDAIVIMRLVRVEDDSTYVPGTYHGAYRMHHGQVVTSPTYVGGTYPSHYAGAWSYYSHAYPTYSNYYSTPGYFDVERYYYFETNLYDVAQDKLVWSSITSTYEPANMEQTTAEVADAVYEEMVEQGFVNEPGGTTSR